MAFMLVHVENSLSQLVMVESGAMTRKGPWMPAAWISDSSVMDWIVFPRPISSARIQFCLRGHTHTHTFSIITHTVNCSAQPKG